MGVVYDEVESIYFYVNIVSEGATSFSELRYRLVISMLKIDNGYRYRATQYDDYYLNTSVWLPPEGKL